MREGGLDPNRPMGGDTSEDLFVATIQELIRVEPFSKVVGLVTGIVLAAIALAGLVVGIVA